MPKISNFERTRESTMGILKRQQVRKYIDFINSLILEFFALLLRTLSNR